MTQHVFDGTAFPAKVISGPGPDLGSGGRAPHPVLR